MRDSGEIFRSAAGAVRSAFQPDRSKSYSNKVLNEFVSTAGDAVAITIGIAAVYKFIKNVFRRSPR